MRQLGQPAEIKADREPTHAPMTEESKRRKSSFFQHNMEGDERGQHRLLRLAVRQLILARAAVATHSLADLVFTYILQFRRQHQYLAGPRGTSGQES